MERHRGQRIWVRNLFFLGLIAAGSVALAASLFPSQAPPHVSGFDARQVEADEFQAAVRQVDAGFRQHWSELGLQPAGPAPKRTIMRRLALALTGTIPSLEDIRRFEAYDGEQRVQWWLAGLLQDRRFADYWAERLARAFVGTDQGPFLVFRRGRFVAWLSDQLHANRPYDQIVRDLIASDGLWTDTPATNFITATVEQANKNRPNPERLAGRVARAFLGVRLDCAQCHNHPYAEWKQEDFQGLAAFFGAARQGLTGTYDGKDEYRLEDRKTGTMEVIAPRVPFLPEALPSQGGRRQRLAAWVTDPRNTHFAQATVNRTWALLFGRPLVEPVDDLGAAGVSPAALRLLADDFAAHGYDLQRLIRLITATEAFRLDSAADHEITDAHEKVFAAFPLTRLRPEQVAGSILQAASLKTLDSDVNLLELVGQYFGEREFVRRYGDTGEDEFDGRGGTIPQRLLLLNGNLVKDKTKDALFNAATRIALLAPDDATAVRTAYLTVLTREPTPPEAAHFEERLKGSKGKARNQRMEDLFWVLLNSTEFSWNH
jgi:hypothetical protein